MRYPLLGGCLRTNARVRPEPTGKSPPRSEPQMPKEWMTGVAYERVDAWARTQDRLWSVPGRCGSHTGSESSTTRTAQAQAQHACRSLPPRLSRVRGDDADHAAHL